MSHNTTAADARKLADAMEPHIRENQHREWATIHATIIPHLVAHLRRCAAAIDHLQAMLHDALEERGAPAVRWQREWPTEPGYYWWMYSSPRHRSGPHLVRAVRTLQGIEVWDDERSYIPHDVGPHLWARAHVPAPPELPVPSPEFSGERKP